jgi:hypothetical protein
MNTGDAVQQHAAHSRSFTAPFTSGSPFPALLPGSLGTEAATRRPAEVIQTNRPAIVLSIAALVLLIDDRLASLRDERRNDPEAQEAIERYESIRASLEAVRHVADAPDDAAAEKVATSFVQGIRNWWDKKHEEICDKAFDAGIRAFDAAIFAGCLGVCALLHPDPLALAVSGAIARGKTVVDALKAIRAGGANADK